MVEEKNDKKKKKNVLAAILESMNKTGGCCGPGETCGGSEKNDANKETENKDKK